MLQLSLSLSLLLATPPLTWAAMYSKSSPVLQVDAKSYNQLIKKSNHTSIVEFYAPWCGHCQNLKPAYEKAATTLRGLANVAAVDCDADANKQFCGSFGVQGFPTLKLVRPRPDKPANPLVQDYTGPRTAAAIVDAVTSKINNFVTRVTDKDLDDFLAKDDRPKALFFTEKGTTSALLRSIAIDYHGVISIAQIRSKESAAVERLNINKFPTLVLLPNGDPDHSVVYDGQLNKDNKDAIINFLRQAGEPNPAPAPPKAKETKTKKADKPKDESTKEPIQESETSSEAAAATPSLSVITTASDKQQVAKKCLQPKSHTCILALIPTSDTHDSQKVVESLSQLNTKYIQGQRHAFSFFAIPDSLEQLSFIRDKLETKSHVELVAMNARRGWWRKYEGDFDAVSVEAWADAIRMGEGAKMKLPSGLLVEDAEADDAKVEQEPTTEHVKTETPEAEDTAEETVQEAQAEKEASEEHDEL